MGGVVIRASTRAPRFRAPYRVDTERLSIRALGPEHVEALSEAIPRNKQHLAPTMPWVHEEPLSLEARTELLLQMRGTFDLGLDFTFGIFERDHGRYIGGTGLHPRIGPDALELGYWIDAGWQGQGLVTETARALSRVAIEFMRAQRVEIRCSPDNRRSSAVAARIGFHLDGVLREAAIGSTGAAEDRMLWTLLASEYPEHPLSREAKPKLFDARGRHLDVRSESG